MITLCLLIAHVQMRSIMMIHQKILLLCFKTGGVRYSHLLVWQDFHLLVKQDGAHLVVIVLRMAILSSSLLHTLVSVHKELLAKLKEKVNLQFHQLVVQQQELWLLSKLTKQAETFHQAIKITKWTASNIFWFHMFMKQPHMKMNKLLWFILCLIFLSNSSRPFSTIIGCLKRANLQQLVE